MIAQPVAIEPEERRLPHTRGVVARMFLVAGCTFTFVGLADLALLWFPPQPGNVAWEYATVGQTMDSMPMPTLGMLLVAYGLLRAAHPSRRSIVLMAAIFFALGVLSSIFALVLFTSAPAVLSQTPPDAVDAVRRAATRQGVQSVAYPLAWFAIASILWKANAMGRRA